jgi:hypothetical protein
MPTDSEIDGAQARRDRVVLAHRLGVEAEQSDMADRLEAPADAERVAIVRDDARSVEFDAPRLEQPRHGRARCAATDA